MEAKDAVRALLDRLPDDCSLEDVLYHLYVLQSVEAGRRDVASGNTISHEEMKSELHSKWVVGRES